MFKLAIHAEETVTIRGFATYEEGKAARETARQAGHDVEFADPAGELLFSSWAGAGLGTMPEPVGLYEVTDDGSLRLISEVIGAD
jgi:hypothetical protein